MPRSLPMKRSIVVAILAMSACAAAGPGQYAASMQPRAIVAAGPAPGGSVATGGPTTATAIPEQLVIEGSMTLEVDEIKDLVPSLRAFVIGMGGRIINESVSGAERSWSAELKLRIPPEKVEEVAEFLAKHGEVTAKHITATDVSKQLFDQELAIKNLRLTLDRLTQVMAMPNLQVPQILAIEQEMTRIRGQIEQLEGDARFLKDRVGLATLDVSISRRAGVVTVAKAQLYPGARAVMLTLFDPAGRTQTRFGGGFMIHTVLRTVSMEVDLFQKEHGGHNTDKHNAVIATLGGATYSDFLGRGQRQTLNPYLGGRLGYAYLDSSRFVIQGEAGVELYKAKYVVLDASLRATALFGSRQDLGLVAGLGAIVAF